MAANTALVSTMLDITKRTDPDGGISALGELLDQSNPILKDMLWKEGNLDIGERVSVRTSLPTTSLRRLNEGVASSKSTSAQIDESCSIFEAWHEVDKDVADLNGNTAAYRVSEARGHVESMNQKFSNILFYGNQAKDEREFDGFATRYNLSTKANGENLLLVDSSASGYISSIYLVGWGYNTCYGIYPKGSKAGLVHEDLGLVTVQTSTTLGDTRMRAYQDRFQWKAGLALKDWRFCVRIADIDVDEQYSGSGHKDITHYMIKALHRIPMPGLANLVWYMNRNAAQDLDIQQRAFAAGTAAITGSWAATAAGGSMEGNGPVLSFRGIPIRVCDAISNSETLVA